MTQVAPIRVLLADPYTMSGLGINQVLTEAEDLRLVGHLHTARDFWLVRKLDLPFFDVLLIDAPVVGGVDVLSTLVAAYPRAVVVYMDVLYITAELLAVAAPGYVSKREDGDTLRAAVRAVGRGETFRSPEMAACEHWFGEHGSGGLAPPQRRIWDRNTGQPWDDL